MTDDDIRLVIDKWDEYIYDNSYESTVPIMVLCSVMLMIFIFSFVGNLLTCIVIYYDRTMHTATNYYLFNLAITDFLVSFGMLIEVDQFIRNGFRHAYYTNEDKSCKIYFCLVVLLWNNGILTVTTLAIERYIAVFHPMMLKSTPVWRRVMKVLAIIWMIAVAEMIPEFWSVAFIQTETTSLCIYIPTNYTKVLHVVLAFLTFLLPLGIIAVAYTMIACHVNVVQNNSCNDRTFNHRDNSRKVNRLVMALTLSFLVCWVPFFMTRIFTFMWNTDQLLKWWFKWCRFFFINTWSSSVLNPILFSLMSTKFRQSLKALWNTKIRRQPERQAV